MSEEQLEIDQPAEIQEETASDTLTTIAIVEADERSFNLTQRRAMSLSMSSLVPKEYAGGSEKAIANVMIAMNMAKRLNADPLHVMQNLYIVHGKPGWSAQFLIATFNASGRFTAMKFRFNKEKTECTAYATELATGEQITGTTVSIDMANAEGWASKQGSKWKTMPEQMLRYRAATFFVRATCPEIALGMYTTDELDDMQVG